MHLCAEDHITQRVEQQARTEHAEAHVAGIGCWLNKVFLLVLRVNCFHGARTENLFFRSSETR